MDSMHLPRQDRSGVTKATDMKKGLPWLRTSLFEYGAAGRIRTHDPLVRSQVLYPTELQPHKDANYSTQICDCHLRDTQGLPAM